MLRRRQNHTVAGSIRRTVLCFVPIALLLGPDPVALGVEAKFAPAVLADAQFALSGGGYETSLLYITVRQNLRPTSGGNVILELRGCLAGGECTTVSEEVIGISDGQFRVYPDMSAVVTLNWQGHSLVVRWRGGGVTQLPTSGSIYNSVHTDHAESMQSYRLLNARAEGRLLGNRAACTDATARTTVARTGQSLAVGPVASKRQEIPRGLACKF